MHTLKIKSFFVILIFAPYLSYAAAPSWEIALQEGRYSEAYEMAKNQESLAQPDFMLGVMALGAEKWTDAKKYFDNAIKTEAEMLDYSYLLRGKAQAKMGVSQKALEDFQKSERLTKSKFVQYLNFLYQAESYATLKQWKKAEGLFFKVEKKLKNTSHHPEALWGLLMSQVQLNKTSKLCRQAKELFMKYPSYEKIADWGIALNENSVNGRKIKCAVTFNEQGLRLQRLLWSGLEDKAYSEILDLKKRAPEQSMFEVDTLYVNYLIHIGHIDEAKTLLSKYQSIKSDDYEFLMLLGKVYARSTTPDKGIESYYKAYKLTSRMQQAAPALFQSSFLSYIVADYKGAQEKFEEFNTKFSKHKQHVDSIWYLAWIQYLRKNYSLAELKFRAIKEDKEKNKRKWKDYGDDRLDYWLAMSLLRQDKKDEAMKLFSSLTHDDGLGYYAVASYQRLKTLGGRVLAQANSSYSVHENWWLPEAIASSVKKDREEDTFSATDPNEEKINEILNYEDKVQEKLSTDLIVKTIPQYLGEDIKSIYFTNTEKVMKRAHTLARAGLDDLAYREVLETESRRITSDQRHWLLSAHKTVNSFNRSLVLASQFFGDQAAKLGLHHGTDYWKHSYPRAYDMIVSHYAEQRAIPQELIWSIMRAETLFRPDAVSPVGARGLMQVMPNTGRKLAGLMGEDTVHVEDLMRPAISAKYGSFYLKRLMTKFKGNVPLVAAAYNGGPHRVHAWMHYFGGLELDEFIEHIPFLETRNYVKKVSKYLAVYNLLYKKKTDVMETLAKPIGFKLDGTVPTKETWERFD